MRRSIISLVCMLVSLALLQTSEVAMSAPTGPVTIEWYGHSCFLLTLQNGAKILIDPYDTTRMPYSLPQEPVDLTFSTHDHFDHNAVNAVTAQVILRADGRKSVFNGTKTGVKELADGTSQVDLKGLTVTCSTVPAFHDEHHGAKRGAMGLIRFIVEGLTFVHLGDLGDTLSQEQIEKLKPVDVLMVPVGGYYTIDSTQAERTVEDLAPRVVLPMHYKTDLLATDFPISTAEGFLKAYRNVHRETKSSITLIAAKLPANMTIEVLKYHGQK
jgi:L-ascorbate metabolism protein UlaG (beta-lactamase superfamily)